MSFSTMYPGKVNSPVTSLNGGITDSATTITVTDASILPDSPNQAIIGNGENAETILYEGKSGNDLTSVTRGYQGTAAAWPSGTQVSRFFTEYDYGAIIDNIEKLQTNNFENLIIDGLFEYFLEHSSIENPATNAYGATLCQVKHAKSSGTRKTITISQQLLASGESNKSKTALRLASSGADTLLDANSYYIFCRHYIFQGTRHYANGQKLTVGFKAKSSVDGQKIAVCIRQNYGTGGSPSSEENISGAIFALTTSMAEYSHTFTTNSNSGKTFGDDNNDCIIIDVFCQAGSTVASNLFGGSSFGFTEAVNVDFTEFRAHQGEELYPFLRNDDRAIVHRWYRISTGHRPRARSYTANVMTFPIYINNDFIKTPAISISGTAGTDLKVGTTASVYQTGFTFAIALSGDTLLVDATKTAHGLTDGYLLVLSPDGYIEIDARY